MWLASLAHPWLTCLHASGVQSAARRAVGRLAPGGAKRHPGFESAMWLASLAHPWLTCLHASGVQSAARRAVGRLAPGGAKRHPGFESAMMIAPRQGCEDPLAGHPEFLELRSSEIQAGPKSAIRNPKSEIFEDFGPVCG